MNRRDFLSTSSKAACACALGTASVLLSHCSAPTDPSTPIDSTGVELEFDLLDSNFAPLQVDGGSVTTGANEIDLLGLLLLRSGDEIKAFTKSCTHEGGPLNAFSNGIARCNWHQAEFNSNGEAISAPATGSLKSYDTELNGDLLTVFGG